jgi:hypothetical protein
MARLLSLVSVAKLSGPRAAPNRGLDHVSGLALTKVCAQALHKPVVTKVAAEHLRTKRG